MTTPARVALIGVCAGSLLVAVAFASAWTPGGAPVWGTWVMVLGSAKLLGAATMLGALNSGVRWSLALMAAVFLSLVIAIGFGAPLLLPVETASSPLFLGLPLRAAIEIYGVGLVPIVVLPLLFAMEFKRDGLDEAGLTALRARCAASHPPTRS
jgi:hypothetical protein